MMSLRITFSWCLTILPKHLGQKLREFSTLFQARLQKKPTSSELSMLSSIFLKSKMQRKSLLHTEIFLKQSNHLIKWTSPAISLKNKVFSLPTKRKSLPFSHSWASILPKKKTKSSVLHKITKRWKYSEGLMAN